MLKGWKLHMIPRERVCEVGFQERREAHGGRKVNHSSRATLRPLITLLQASFVESGQVPDVWITTHISNVLQLIGVMLWIVVPLRGERVSWSMWPCKEWLDSETEGNTEHENTSLRRHLCCHHLYLLKERKMLFTKNYKCLRWTHDSYCSCFSWLIAYP